jgi:hypothetical protein
MLIQTAKAVAAATIIAAAFAVAGFSSAQAQTESVTKQCGDKWAAAKAAGTTGGLTWPKFLGQCRTQMAATPASATTPDTAAAPAAPAPTTASAPAPRTTRKTAAKPAPTAPASDAVFPTAVSTKYSTLSAGKARMQTCLDQYNANKTTNANGGLKWIQKGGGYYSQCNTHLKS